MLPKVLTKLFTKGALNATDDIALRYGSQIGKSLASNYGDDVARSLVPTLSSKPTLTSGSKLSQLLTGVDDVVTLNPAVSGNYSVLGATNKALPSTATFKDKLRLGGKRLETAGTKLRNNELIGSIRDAKVLERSPEAIQYADKFGINSNQYKDIAEIMTGNKGILSNFNNNALEQARMSVIFPDKARINALKAIDKQVTMKPHIKNNLKRVINDAYDVTTGKINDRLVARGESRAAFMGETDIFDLHKTVQELEKMAYEQTGQGAEAAKKVLRTYANELKKPINEVTKDIYKNADNAGELLAALEGANLPPKLSLDIINKIRNGVDYLGMRNLQSPFVTMGQIARNQELAPLVGGVGYNRNMMGGPIQQILGETIGKPLATGVGKTMQVAGRAGQLASQGTGAGTLGKLTKYGAIGAGGLGVLNLLGAGGGSDVTGDGMVGGGVNPAMAGAGVAGLDTGGDGTGMSLFGGGGLDGGTGEAELSIGGYTQSQLENAYVAALMDDNLQAANAIGTMIDMLDKKVAASAKANEKSEKAGANEGKIDGALNVVSSLESLYNSFGGAQGIIGGNVTNALNTATGGAFNSEVAAYNDMIGGSLAPIIKAMGDSGNLSDSDMKRARDLIPAVTDSPEKARIKFRELKNLLNQARQKSN